VIIPRIVQNI